MAVRDEMGREKKIKLELITMESHLGKVGDANGCHIAFHIGVFVALGVLGARNHCNSSHTDDLVVREPLEITLGCLRAQNSIIIPSDVPDA